LEEHFDSASSDQAHAVKLAARQQAGLLIPALLMLSVEEDSLDKVRALRDELGSRHDGDLLSDADFEAIDLLLDCADQIPEARAEAKALVESGIESTLRDPMQRACAD
jgi:hypothetical protein